MTGKIDVLKDLYDTINISQCIIYINSKNKLNDVYQTLMKDEFLYHLSMEN